MIRLPQNLSQINGENITLRFTSTDECGYKLLFEAGSARLAHKMLALESEAEEAELPRDEFDAPVRPIAEINADKERAIAALNNSRYADGQGRHCLILTVGEAIRLVAPIEQIKKLSGLGVPVTAHNFTTAEVGAAATEILERFEHSIQQVSEAANTQDLGNMFLPAPGGFGH
jgi:hypothetical protein